MKLTNPMDTVPWPRLLFAMVLLLGSWSPLSFAADALPLPQGRVVLTVTGKLAVTNADNKAEFDMDMLAALPQHEFRTTTPWTEGEHLFRGVLLSDLLRRLGAEGAEVRAVALNDYHHDIERRLVAEMPLLLTTHFDGKPMKVRHKGPIWLMLPLSDLPRFNTKRYHELLIWQLKSLDVR